MSNYLVECYAVPTPTPTLAPGSKHSNIHWGLGDDGRNIEPPPDMFTVMVQYSDDRGRAYTDQDALTVATFTGETFSRPGEDNNAEKRLATALEAIARGIGSST